MPRPHYYEPVHMTKTSHTRPCCGADESAHPAYPAEDSRHRIRLTRAVRGLRRTEPKGLIVEARFSTLTAMQEVTPATWGTVPSTGLFGQLTRGEYRDVKSPGWVIDIAGINTHIPVRWGEEV